MANKFQQFLNNSKEKIITGWRYLVDLLVNKINIKNIYAIWIAGPIIGFLNYFDNKPGLKYGFLCTSLSLLFSGMSFLPLFALVSTISFTYTYLQQGLYSSQNSLVHNLFSALQKGLLAASLLTLLNFSPIVSFFVGHTIASVFYSVKSYFTDHRTESVAMDSLESLDVNPIRKGYLAGTMSVTNATGLIEKDQSVYRIVSFLAHMRSCLHHAKQPPASPEPHAAPCNPVSPISPISPS